MSFLYTKFLGFAHYEGRVVAVEMLTCRKPSMMIPGGSKLFGEVVNDQIRRVDEFPEEVFVPESLQLGLIALSKWLEEGNHDFPTDMDGSMGPTPYRAHGAFWILAYTEEDAATFAYTAGMQVQEGFWYGDMRRQPFGNYFGAVWRCLIEHQKREERSERT